MTFAVTNVINSCFSQEHQPFLNKRNGVTLIIDTGLMMGAAVVGGLVLASLLNIGLSPDAANYVAWGFIAAGGAIPVADVLTALVKYIRKKDHSFPLIESGNESVVKIHEGQRYGSDTGQLKEMKGLELMPLAPAGHIVFREKGKDAECHGVWGKDQSYEGDQEANIDFSYVNPSLECGFVFDGSGHNNSLANKILEPIVKRFVAVLENDLANKEFETIEEGQEFVNRAMLKLAILFRDPEHENKVYNPDFYELPKNARDDASETYTLQNRENCPAISFAFIINIEGQRYLLAAQMGDSFLVIENTKGECEYIVNSSSTMDKGIGHDIGKNSYLLPEVIMKPLDPNDNIWGFSDGVGEFLTKEELTDVIQSTTDISNILGNIKNKIMKLRTKEEDRSGLIRANAKRSEVKYWDPDPKAKGHHDDMSFFCLEKSLYD